MSRLWEEVRLLDLGLWYCSHLDFVFPLFFYYGLSGVTWVRREACGGFQVAVTGLCPRSRGSITPSRCLRKRCPGAVEEAPGKRCPGSGGFLRGAQTSWEPAGPARCKPPAAARLGFHCPGTSPLLPEKGPFVCSPFSCRCRPHPVPLAPSTALRRGTGPAANSPAWGWARDFKRKESGWLLLDLFISFP